MNFEEWNHHLRSNCGHYYGEPGKARLTAGCLFRMHDRHGVEVAEIGCAIDRIERTPMGIRRDDAEHIFLLLQQSGTTRVTHNGHEEVLAPGDCILLDSTLPAKLGYEGRPAAFLSAHLPRGLCLEGRSQPLATGRKIPNGHPLRASFQSLMALEPNAAAKQYAPDFLIDLVGLAFGGESAAMDAMRVRDRHHRFKFIASAIDRSLTDPDLTLDWLVTQVHMSRRQLQREFRDHGTSFTSYLQCQRLKFVAEQLRQAARLRQSPSISDLAYRSGFGDISHFNRAFRHRYGTAPRAFLKEAGERLRPH